MLKGSVFERAVDKEGRVVERERKKEGPLLQYSSRYYVHSAAAAAIKPHHHHHDSSGWLLKPGPSHPSSKSYKNTAFTTHTPPHALLATHAATLVSLTTIDQHSFQSQIIFFNQKMQTIRKTQNEQRR
jgi:hypothetical protein